MNILIMGAGNIGSALGKILKKKKHRVEYWDAAPGMVKKQKELSAAAAGAEMVFFCLPSFAVSAAAKSIRPFLKRKIPVVCVAKGIENETFLTVDRLLRKVLPPRQPFAVLFGPMFARELSAGREGFAVAAGPARHEVVALFAETNFCVSESSDLAGVAVAGALKNIYAIGFGVLEAVRANYNVRGAYASVAIGETERIIRVFGGRTETALSLAGLGDLVATGFSQDSKNRYAGYLLGCGRKGCHSEGTRAVVSLAKILGKKIINYPLLEFLAALLSGQKSPRELIHVLADVLSHRK